MDERTRGYRIVVGISFSDESQHAVREALELATRLPGAEVHFTSVLDREHLDRSSALAEGYSHMLDTERRLVAFVKDVASRTPLLPASIALVFHVRIGPVAAALTQVAFDVDASLLVVGSRSTTPIEKLITRSVSEALLREGRYSVLVAHARNTEGMVKSPRPEPRRPGEPLTSPREEILQSAERVDFHLPPAHIAGLL